MFAFLSSMLVCLFVCLLVGWFVWLFVCLFVFLFVCLSVQPHQAFRRSMFGCIYAISSVYCTSESSWAAHTHSVQPHQAFRRSMFGCPSRARLLGSILKRPEWVTREFLTFLSISIYMYFTYPFQYIYIYSLFQYTCILLIYFNIHEFLIYLFQCICI